MYQAGELLVFKSWFCFSVGFSLSTHIRRLIAACNSSSSRPDIFIQPLQVCDMHGRLPYRCKQRRMSKLIILSISLKDASTSWCIIKVMKTAQTYNWFQLGLLNSEKRSNIPQVSQARLQVPRVSTHLNTCPQAPQWFRGAISLTFKVLMRSPSSSHMTQARTLQWQKVFQED